MNEEALISRLRAHKLRPTRARLAIMKLFQEPGVNHLACESIVKTLLKRDSSMGQATLYQNVNLLADRGVLIRFKGPGGILLHDGTTAHHHHLVCNQCGHITEVLIEGHCENLTPYPYDNEESMDGWTVEDVKVEFFGTCANCQKS